MINRETRVSLLPILLVNFIGTLGFSIVLPFLVFLVMKFGGDAVVYSILAATYPAFQLIGAPILGKWSDIYKKKGPFVKQCRYRYWLDTISYCISLTT